MILYIDIIHRGRTSGFRFWIMMIRRKDAIYDTLIVFCFIYIYIYNMVIILSYYT